MGPPRIGGVTGGVAPRGEYSEAPWLDLDNGYHASPSRAGLPAVGENAGPPAAETGGVSGSDSELEQIRRSPGYARACGLASFHLAFEDDLFTDRSGASPADYQQAIGT